MSCSSERGAIYRGMVEDVIAGGLLEDDEKAELLDMLRRIERNVAANMPADQASEAAE